MAQQGAQEEAPSEEVSPYAPSASDGSASDVDVGMVALPAQARVARQVLGDASPADDKKSSTDGGTREVMAQDSSQVCYVTPCTPLSSTVTLN